jgi:hypothetical protein
MGSFGPTLVVSRGSRSEITESSVAQSSTLRVMGPIWSRLEANATRP